MVGLAARMWWNGRRVSVPYMGPSQGLHQSGIVSDSVKATSFVVATPNILCLVC